MAKKDRKQRRKHLQPEIGTEKKDQQLISELGLVSPKENLSPEKTQTEKNNSYMKFVSDYRAYRKERDAEDHDRTVRRGRLSLLGIVTFFFAVVGVVAALQFCVNTGVSIANQTRLKEELTPAITAYVVIDVPEFEDISGLSDTAKQRVAAWYLLLNTDLSIYQQDDYDNLFVPFDAMNLCAKKLFGTDITLKPKSDYTGSLSITYDEESLTYLLPTQPDYATYYPVISGIKKHESGYDLTVQYMATDLLENLKPSSTATVIKTMQYHLEETDIGWQVKVVKLLSIEADSYYQPDNNYPTTPSTPSTPDSENTDDVA